MLPQHQYYTCERQDLQLELNSCYSDLSDSLNSLNSMKVLLHLGKTNSVLKIESKFIRILIEIHSIMYSSKLNILPANRALKYVAVRGAARWTAEQKKLLQNNLN